MEDTESTMEEMVMSLEFYRGKKVLITGHNGFKGSWLCKILDDAGAYVVGVSLKIEEKSNLFELMNLSSNVVSIVCDIRNINDLMRVFKEYQPEIVFHLAAQPIVRKSYKEPVYTYETNVMGTVNLMECIRLNGCVKSVVNVTTDKVYENMEENKAFDEKQSLDGFDPYSNSKSCSELVTHCYKRSYFDDLQVRVSTARAGNVIGGGDFAEDRIIPDCIRSALENKAIVVRNPKSIRPYQHVLEPLYVYLMIAQKQMMDKVYEGYYNVGPEEKDCISTAELVNIFCEKWKEDLKWISPSITGPHEAKYLRLDCTKLKTVFNWAPRWSIDTAIEKTVEWAKCYKDKKDVNECMSMQIKQFFGFESVT